MRYNFRMMHMINQYPSATGIGTFPAEGTQVHLNHSISCREACNTIFRQVTISWQQHLIRHNIPNVLHYFLFPMSVKSRYSGCLDSQTRHTYSGKFWFQLSRVKCQSGYVRIISWIFFFNMVLVDSFVVV